ncbi:hypothetical protein Avbf_17546 [Armadillidium vulgare]|nr:hypothetical protein Avbf_17546 [Armadillidium vulgare]
MILTKMKTVAETHLGESSSSSSNRPSTPSSPFRLILTTLNAERRKTRGRSPD